MAKCFSALYFSANARGTTEESEVRQARILNDGLLFDQAVFLTRTPKKITGLHASIPLFVTVREAILPGAFLLMTTDTHTTLKRLGARFGQARSRGGGWCFNGQHEQHGNRRQNELRIMMDHFPLPVGKEKSKNYFAVCGLVSYAREWRSVFPLFIFGSTQKEPRRHYSAPPRPTRAKVMPRDKYLAAPC